MYKVHGYIGNKLIINYTMVHLPRKGDTLRLSEDRFATVTEVIWCLDEKSPSWQRVNLRIKVERTDGDKR